MNEIFRKNVTWLRTKLYTLFRQYIFLNIFLGLRCVFVFFKWNYSISFCRINNFSFYLNRNKLRNEMLWKSLGKMHDAWYMFFGICPCTSRTPEFLHTYSNFILIVDPWTICKHNASFFACLVSVENKYFFEILVFFSSFSGFQSKYKLIFMLCFYEFFSMASLRSAFSCFWDFPVIKIN